MPARPQRRRSRSLEALCLLMIALATAACATTPMPTSVDTAPVDLERFMGDWHVIAHVPYVGERGHVASSYRYTLHDDGGISVRYAYREGFDQPLEAANSRATVKEGTGNREWTIWVYRMLPTKFRILEVAPDDSWALIDYPGRNLAWVFARDRLMNDAQYRELEGRMRGHGVNTDKLRRIPQVREQVGKLGFAPASKQ